MFDSSLLLLSEPTGYIVDTMLAYYKKLLWNNLAIKISLPFLKSLVKINISVLFYFSLTFHPEHNFSISYFLSILLLINSTVSFFSLEQAKESKHFFFVISLKEENNQEMLQDSNPHYFSWD
jgi:hypothetical protein